MTTRAKSFTYQTRTSWREGMDGVITSQGKPEVAISAPAEFKGSDDRWSPECLFIASVETCLMLTFLSLARARKVEIAAYESSAEGLLEAVYGKRVISRITVRPKITMKAEADREKVQALAERMEEDCYISNSIETDVLVETEIVVQS